MLIIGGILYGAGILGSLVCWIMVLVKMFKTEQSPLQGIIGIFCSLWAYIWGWMNSTKLGIKNIMLIWTAAIISAAIGGSIFFGAMAVKAQEMQAIPSTTSHLDLSPTE